MVIYAGIAVAADNIRVLAMLVPVLLIMNFGVIVREERNLEGNFGESYLQYKAAVRRWE